MIDESSAEYTSLERLSFDELLHQRSDFYERFKDKLGPTAKGLYPAPGLDPVPADRLGESIIYLGAPSDSVEHAALLKGEIPLNGTTYQQYLKEHGPFPNLKFIFGDILQPQFKDGSFDYLILRNPPPFLYEDKRFLTQIDRVLKKGGTVILDSEDEDEGEVKKVPAHEVFMNQLIKKGYQFDQELDRIDGKREIYQGEGNWYIGSHEFRVLKSSLNRFSQR